MFATTYGLTQKMDVLEVKIHVCTYVCTSETFLPSFLCAHAEGTCPLLCVEKDGKLQI